MVETIRVNEAKLPEFIKNKGNGRMVVDFSVVGDISVAKVMRLLHPDTSPLGRELAEFLFKGIGVKGINDLSRRIKEGDKYMLQPSSKFKFEFFRQERKQKVKPNKMKPNNMKSGNARRKVKRFDFLDFILEKMRIEDMEVEDLVRRLDRMTVEILEKRIQEREAARTRVLHGPNSWYPGGSIKPLAQSYAEALRDQAMKDYMLRAYILKELKLNQKTLDYK